MIILFSQRERGERKRELGLRRAQRVTSEKERETWLVTSTKIK